LKRKASSSKNAGSDQRQSANLLRPCSLSVLQEMERQSVTSRTLLDQINSPRDLRQLAESDLSPVADELRQETINAVSVTGGHQGRIYSKVDLDENGIVAGVFEALGKSMVSLRAHRRGIGSTDAVSS
jgi:hypothetical protein